MTLPLEYGPESRLWVMLCGQRRPLAQNDDMRCGAMPDENLQILRLSTLIDFRNA